MESSTLDRTLRRDHWFSFPGGSRYDLTGTQFINLASGTHTIELSAEVLDTGVYAPPEVGGSGPSMPQLIVQVIPQ